MKIQTALSACIVLLLGGCASYSGNTYRQDIVYAGDGYYRAPDADRTDDGYYDDTYYDGGYDGGSYGGGSFSFGYGFGDPFSYGSRYGYCPWRYAICPGDPLAVFLFPIGGGRYWLLFDGYDDRSYYYGGGYGWPYWWGFPNHHRDHDHDGDGHHHHHDDPPDPVVATPPPNGWVPSPRDGRRFITPHPRKGVFTANGTTPRSDTAISDDSDVRARVPRARPDPGFNSDPPMRWRPPTLTHSPPVDRPLPVRDAPEPVRIRRQLPVASSDQTRLYVSEPVRRSRPEPSEALAPPPPVARPEPQPVSVPNQDSSDDRPARGRRRGDGSGDG